MEREGGKAQEKVYIWRGREGRHKRRLIYGEGGREGTREGLYMSEGGITFN